MTKRSVLAQVMTASAALVVVACVKGTGTDPAKADTSRKPVSTRSELADSTAAGDRRPAGRDESRTTSGPAKDVCALLSAKEIEEITGLPIERAEKKPNGCDWYAKPAAQQQKGADTVRDTFAKLNKEEPKSAQELVGSMQNLLKGVGGAVAPDKPLFAVLVQKDNADAAEAMLKTTVAISGGSAAGGGLEPIDGLGDRAFIGAMGAIFYVRKGPTLITFGSMGTREDAIALARRIVPRID
jgi:hypothetical protein